MGEGALLGNVGVASLGDRGSRRDFRAASFAQARGRTADLQPLRAPAISRRLRAPVPLVRIRINNVEPAGDRSLDREVPAGNSGWKPGSAERQRMAEGASY